MVCYLDSGYCILKRQLTTLISTIRVAMIAKELVGESVEQNQGRCRFWRISLGRQIASHARRPIHFSNLALPVLRELSRTTPKYLTVYHLFLHRKSTCPRERTNIIV